MPVTVKWARERITFDLPPPDTKLEKIRESLAEYTHLPKNAFKLIHAGALMRDDNAPISAYGLHQNSTIAIIATADHFQEAPHQPALPPAARTEPATVQLIQSELARVRSDLTPDVHTFLDTLATRAPGQEKEHNRLGELLLQSLLRLDAIAPNHDWEDARRERKVAVKEVQGLLDSVDSAWDARMH